jgi:ATP-binding cassette subfamily C (CFTR/MRP) protein 1
MSCRTEFSDRTVLTIAHRLKTILWMDRVLVIDRGCLIEHGRPADLLQVEGGVFRAMCEGSNAE